MEKVESRSSSRVFCWNSSFLNIYLNDLVFLCEFTDVCNFADDTAFYACHKDVNSLTKKLEYDSFLAIKWSENNNMKLNQDKCFTCSFSDIGNEKIWESNKKKLLGLDIDKNLNFSE